MSLAIRGKSSCSRTWNQAQTKAGYRFRTIPNSVRVGHQHGSLSTNSASTNEITATVVSTTMDLVSLDDRRSKSNSIYSTLQILAEHDVWMTTTEQEQSKRRRREAIAPQVWKDLLEAAELVRQSRPQTMIESAVEMNLVQASQCRQDYDKILLLVNHAEDESQVTDMSLNADNDELLLTDSLTRRGVGQALNLSRRTATFCHNDVEANRSLQPQLFVVGASRRVLQTTFLGFPYDTPYHSIRGTPWMCHPYASCVSLSSSSSTGRSAVVDNATISDLQREFSGIDCSWCSTEAAAGTSTTTNTLSRHERIEKAMDLLEWLQEREEQVIVVSGNSCWMQAMGCILNYKGASTEYSNGEMRVIGVRFG